VIRASTTADLAAHRRALFHAAIGALMNTRGLMKLIVLSTLQDSSAT
jgi:uncharacterized protein involved in propanediol utilization